MICAIITTYAPEAALITNVAQVAEQVDEVILVDDGATEINRELLQQWFGANPGVHVLHMEKNSGIAAALNRGVAFAKTRGADCVFTLDDDTRVACGLVSVLVEHLCRRESTGIKVGLIACRWAHDMGLLSGDFAGAASAPVSTLITSGCLMPVSAFDAVGGFREEFFIDSVDFDMCFKLQDAGYALLQLDAIGMAHSLGEGATRRIFGVTLHSTNHSPLRRYYAVRNSLTLARERLFTNPGFALRVVVWWPLTILKIVLIEDRRRAKLSAIAVGIRDFLARRYGRKSL